MHRILFWFAGLVLLVITNVRISFVHAQTSVPILADGQFVNGADSRAFDVRAYLAENAPHLLPYADILIDQAETYSINPRVLLTLLELESGAVTNPSIPIESDTLIAQIDAVSERMLDAFYAAFFGADSPFVTEIRDLWALTDGTTIRAEGYNAGTQAVIAAFAPVRDTAGIARLVDPAAPDGFYATYRRLFPNADPLATTNRVYRPSDAEYQALPPFAMQFPLNVGESIYFNGVHNNAGGTFGGTPTDMSSIDLTPGVSFPAWSVDNANMWVRSASEGVPTRVNNCKVYLTHADGWETHYFHLEAVPTFSPSSLAAGEPIGKIANTEAEALCVAGFSTGPHLHFSIRRNGVFQPIHGANLGGWTINSGTTNYDSACARMWLERGNEKRCAYSQSIQNDGELHANLALNKTATASSTLTGTTTASKATDGNLSTAWASVQGVDPQWITVDLGDVYPVAQVVLKWETAFAESFRIDISDDNATWTTAAVYTARNGGTETLSVQKNGRYVRIYGLTRGHSGFGYALWEVEVYSYNAFPITPPTGRLPAPVPDGSTLFFDNFNGAEPDPQWVSRGGTWSIVDNALQISDACSTPGGSGLQVGDETWDDYEVQFDMMGIAGSGKTFLFRFLDEVNRYQLDMRSLENDLHLYTPSHGDSSAPYPFDNGHWYRVRVRADGESIGVYVDGQLVLQRTDAGTPRRTGGISLWLNSGSINCPFTVQYDNVIVNDLGTNALENGGFSSGITGWGTWDAITYRVINGIFEFYHNGGGATAVVLQETGLSVGDMVTRAGGQLSPNGSTTIEALIDIGNTSSIRKRTTILLHDADFSDLQVCTFWLPPNTPLRTYRMQTFATQAWENATISIYASNADNVGWTQIDNVRLRARPDLAVNTTRCFDPGLPS